MYFLVNLYLLVVKSHVTGSARNPFTSASAFERRFTGFAGTSYLNQVGRVSVNHEAKLVLRAGEGLHRKPGIKNMPGSINIHNHLPQIILILLVEDKVRGLSALGHLESSAFQNDIR